MDDWFIILGVLFYLLFVMYAANCADAELWQQSTVRLFLYSLSVFMFLMGPFGMQAILISLQSANEEIRQLIDPLQVSIVSVFALCCATFSYNLVRAEELRQWLAVRVNGYNAQSMVHLAAVLLSLLVLTLNLFQFVLSGGLNGVAQAFEETSSITYGSLFETVLLLVAAFLGVGYAIRRTMPQTLLRLGLRSPTRADIIPGLLIGAGLYLLSIVFTLIWAQLSDPQTFSEQTRAAQQLSSQLVSVPLILLVAGGAAIGEEIFMRGALQPIFGIWLTSAFFALLHSQYLFTPTTLFIFALGVVFGQIRQRISTTAAITAHFTYNTAPFALLIVLGGTL